MPKITIRLAQAADAPALATLANQHTFQNLPASERASGYLTGSFAEADLRARLASAPSQVAYRQDELIGFALTSRLAADQYPPFIQALIAALPDLRYQQRPLTEYRWFFYGPVLVRPEYRSQGLLRQLFAATKQALMGRFDLSVAFIASANEASLRAHRQLGLETVGELVLQGLACSIVVFPVV